MINWTKNKYLYFDGNFPRLAKIGRYLVSGGTAAAVDLVLLFVFTHFFHIWYILSAILAFICAFFVSFFLQKFWTFRDSSKEGAHKQMVVYFIVSSTNLAINTFFVYLFTDIFNFHYIISQIIASALIAIESFFIYRYFIFNQNNENQKPIGA